MLSSIEEQGKLTEELKNQIRGCRDNGGGGRSVPAVTGPSGRTRAMIAREKGLEGLADVILLQMTKKPLAKEAESLYF